MEFVVWKILFLGKKIVQENFFSNFKDFFPKMLLEVFPTIYTPNIGGLRPPNLAGKGKSWRFSWVPGWNPPDIFPGGFYPDTVLVT